MSRRAAWTWAARRASRVPVAPVQRPPVLCRLLASSSTVVPVPPTGSTPDGDWTRAVTACLQAGKVAKAVTQYKAALGAAHRFPPHVVPALLAGCLDADDPRRAHEVWLAASSSGGHPLDPSLAILLLRLVAASYDGRTDPASVLFPAILQLVPTLTASHTPLSPTVAHALLSAVLQHSALATRGRDAEALWALLYGKPSRLDRTFRDSVMPGMAALAVPAVGLVGAYNRQAFELMVCAYARNHDVYHARQWLALLSLANVSPTLDTYHQIFAALLSHTSSMATGPVDAVGMSPPPLTASHRLTATASTNPPAAPASAAATPSSTPTPISSTAAAPVRHDPTTALSHVQAFWQELTAAGLIPTVTTYTFMLDAFLRARDLEGATSTMTELLALVPTSAPTSVVASATTNGPLAPMAVPESVLKAWLVVGIDGRQASTTVTQFVRLCTVLQLTPGISVYTAALQRLLGPGLRVSDVPPVMALMDHLHASHVAAPVALYSRLLDEFAALQAGAPALRLATAAVQRMPQFTLPVRHERWLRSQLAASTNSSGGGGGSGGARGQDSDTSTAALHDALARSPLHVAESSAAAERSLLRQRGGVLALLLRPWDYVFNHPNPFVYAVGTWSVGVAVGCVVLVGGMYLFNYMVTSQTTTQSAGTTASRGHASSSPPGSPPAAVPAAMSSPWSLFESNAAGHAELRAAVAHRAARVEVLVQEKLVALELAHLAEVAAAKDTVKTEPAIPAAPEVTWKISPRELAAVRSAAEWQITLADTVSRADRRRAADHLRGVQMAEEQARARQAQEEADAIRAQRRESIRVRRERERKEDEADKP